MTTKRRWIVAAVLLAMGPILCVCAVAGGIYWGTGPDLRCQVPASGNAEAGWSARTVLSGGRRRCFVLYVPPGLDPAQPAPVVVSLHGFASNPNSHAAITGWHRLAEGEGFLVVYPQGTGYPQRWNTGQGWSDVEVDDVQFFRDMLAALDTVAAIDRSRVYVNGMSNGGGMTLRIGCEAADAVAAIGSVAGAVVALEGCRPSRPLPAIGFHGTADPLVSYAGMTMDRPWRRGGQPPEGAARFLGAEEWVGLWAEGNGCDAEPDVIPPRGDVSGVRYTGCDQDAEVILYTIDDGGHTWPGGMPIPIVGKTSADIDATEAMWFFFQAYRLR